MNEHNVVLTAKVPHMESMTHQDIVDSGYGMTARELEHYTLMEQIADSEQYNMSQYPDPEIMISDEADVIIMVTQGRDKMAEDWDKYASTRADNLNIIRI
jgi:hypothetical protein